MKLNTPETAPKGEMILADFGRGLVPAIWSNYDREWSVAEVEEYCPGDSYELIIENEFADEKSKTNN